MRKLDKRAISILVIAIFLISMIPVVQAAPITITLPSGITYHQVGDKIFVEGAGVISGATVNLYWDYVTTLGLMNNTLGKPGSTYEVSMKIPDSVVGDHWIWVKDMDAISTESIKVVVEPKIKPSATSGLKDDEITVAGTGFSKTKDVRIFFGTTTGPTTPIQSFYGDGTETEFTLTVPDNSILTSITGIDVGVLTPITAENIGTGNAVLVTFAGTLLNTPVVPGSVSVTDGVETFSDNGAGILTGSATGTGTINYATGAISVTFFAPPPVGPITADYDYYNPIPLTSADYTVNYVTGEVTLDTAPASGAPIDIDYVYTSYPLDVTRGTPKTNDVGTFSTTFIVPTTGTGITAYDAKGYTVGVAFIIGAGVTLTPEKGPTGTVVTIAGRGFTPLDVITVKVDGLDAKTEDLTISITLGATATTFTEKWVIPNVASTGDKTVTVNGNPTTGDVISEFEVTGIPKIKISPGFGTPGTTVNIEGYNFTQITDTVVTLDFGVMTALKTYKTDSKGEFSGTFEVQAVSFTDHTIKAYDEYGLEDTDTFRVGMMVIIISPRSGPTGDLISLSGTGFSYGEPWNASIEGILVASGTADGIGLISDTFYLPTLEPGTHTVTVMDIDTEIELTEVFTVTDTTKVTLDPTVAPNDYNVTLKGFNFADKLDGTLEFVLYNSTAHWDIDVLIDPGTNDATTDNDGNFTAYWVVLDKDTLSIGDYTINVTGFDDLFVQVPFSVVAARVSVEPRKILFDRGDTIQFNVRNDFDFDESYMRIWDPDDNLFWETAPFDKWLKVGSLYTVPYYLQTSGGNLMELSQDAPIGTWFWIFYETGTTQLVNGTFEVGPSTAAQIGDMLEEVTSDLSGLSDDLAGMSDDFANEMAGMSDDFANEMAGLSDDFADDIAGLANDIAQATDAGQSALDAVEDLAGSMTDLGDAMSDMTDLVSETSDAAQSAADAANDAVQAAQDAKDSASGLTSLVYGAIGASLIAALAAIVSLMQISKRIAG